MPKGTLRLAAVLGWLKIDQPNGSLRNMSQMSDWNQRIVDEFRANDGHVGGPFRARP